LSDRQTAEVVSGDKHPPEENAEFWTIPAQGYVVQMLSVDFRLSLLLKPNVPSEDSVSVVIETPFTYTDSEGQSVALNPAGIRRDLGPVLDCFGRTVERLLVWKPTGRLDLGFTDSSRIAVEAADEYEAWDVVGPGSLKFVCIPGGGEPAIWY
jgi:hypothetical protein